MTSVEFTAVILASTCGARLYPLTTSKDEFDEKVESSYLPKHLLPFAGRPLLQHLLEHCNNIGLERIVIAIGSDDDATKDSLLSMGCSVVNNEENEGNTMSNPVVEDPTLNHSESTEKAVGIGDDETFTKDEFDFCGSKIFLVTLLPECAGSADALRYVASANVIFEKSHVMVLPADLVLYEQLVSRTSTGIEDGNRFGVDALGSLADVHRREYRAGIKNGMPLAMSMLLSDVGEEDENGVPLKESAKAKKGSVSREDEDIEYIGISTIKKTDRPPIQRIVVKQSKYNVEEDEDNTGSTPKLHIPKARLHSPMNQITIKASWNDLHVFCFAPWVLKLLDVKSCMKELAKEFVPFLVSCQFRGVKAAFGVNERVKYQKNESDTSIDTIIQIMNDLKLSGDIVRGSIHFEDELGDAVFDADNDHPFLVSAKVLSRYSSKLVLRACTIPAYMYACREVVTQAIASSKVIDENCSIKKDCKISYLYLPEGTSVNNKFNSITLPGGMIGDKVQVKSSTIGRNTSIGNRCRLNNVVVHDNVKIGENCVLQNSVLSEGCVIGNNCNLNDCQVGSGSDIPAGTKAKGESF